MGEKALHLLCPEPVRRGLTAEVMERAQEPLTRVLPGAGGVVIIAEHLAHRIHQLEAGILAEFRFSIILTQVATY
jgi:hypothetical protein